MFSFEIQATCPHTGARAGILHTAHGDIETPVFMPVGTQATVKGLLPRDLIDDLDAKIILGNTYHLYLRPGHETIRQLGGLHKFMNWPRAILTDSGGFQVFSLSGLRKITEEGVDVSVASQWRPPHVHARVDHRCPARPRQRHHDGARRVPGISGDSRGRARVDAAHGPVGAQRRMRNISTWQTTGERACFPIVQGSMYPDLRRACAEQLLELDADGYAIGGLSVGEPRALSLEMTEITAPLLPADRPRYVMGVGMPEELPEYVARGVDMMDCVLPSRNARNGYLFTTFGRVVIKQAQYKEDPRPIDEACPCYTCRNFSRAYLRHLFLAGEMTFSTLATLHNLQRYLDIMREIRQAILFGKVPEYLKAARQNQVDASG